MKDNLKEFVDHHREAFDDQVPPELWAAISSGMKAPSHAFMNLKKLAKMFKYSIGASAILIATFFMFQSLNKPKLSVQIPASGFQNTNIKSIHPIEPEAIPTQVTESLVSEAAKTTASAPTNTVFATSTKAQIAPVLPAFNSEKTATPKEPLSGFGMISHPAQTSTAGSFSELSPDSNSIYAVDTLFKGIKKLIVSGNHTSLRITGKDQNAVSLKGNVSKRFGEIITRRGFKKEPHQTTRERIKFSVHDSTLKVWVESEVLSKDTKADNKVKGEQGLFFEVPVHTRIVVRENSGNVSIKNITDSLLTLHSNFGSITAENICADLDVTTHSGDISLNSVTGVVHCVSSFGKQNLVQIKGNLKSRSSSGEVNIHSLSGNAEVTSTFGSQKFENVNGNIQSTTTSGNIEVEHLTGNLISRSSFGNQDLDNVNGKISATAGSGNITLESGKGTFTLRTTFGNIRGTNLSLQDNCNFTTSSGDISMQLSNELSELSFDLSSGSGDLQIKKGDAEFNSDKKLTVNKGPIQIKGVSSFGDQRYK